MQRDAYERLFELYSEAVAVLRNNKIIYMNIAFRRMFPDARAGCAADGVLPEYLCEYESDRFTTSAQFGEEKHIVSVSAMGCDRIVTIYPSDGEKMIADWDNFLSSLSGELRNAISVIRITTDAVREKSDTASGLNEKYTAMLTHSAYCAIRLTNNIDMLRSIATGRAKKSVEHFDIVRLCAELVDSANFLLDRGDFHISFSSSEESLGFIGDRDKIEQLVLNLLSNSVKYTDLDGKIAVTLNARRNGVMITVSDNGRGIKPENLMTSFESYTKKRELSDGKAGMGVGLALVDFIAKLHGGYALVESAEGKGTKVTVMIRSDDADGLHDVGSEYKTSRSDNLFTVLSDVLDYRAYLPENMD